MKMKRTGEIGIALLIFVCVSSCQSMPKQARDGEPAGPVEVVPAKTTAGGRVVVYEWSRGDEEKKALLGGNYGLMIFYDVFSKNPVPRFDLYLGESARVVRATGLEGFKAELGRIPAGEILHYYNTCCGGTHHALSPAVLEEVKKCCAERGITFQRGDDEIFVICTCR